MPRVTISEPGKTPQPYRFKLERKTVKIGRSSDSDIIIECGSASTHHCSMERVDGGFILRDNDSTNGIKLDETLMQVIDLHNGMEILIGDVPMKFQLSEEEIEELSGEELTTHQKKKLPPKKDDKQTGDSSSKKDISRPSPSSSTPPKVQNAPTTLNFFVVFILMIAAIILGLSLRHCQETGGDNLPAKWLNGDSGQKTAEPEKDENNEQNDQTEESEDTGE